MEKTTTSTKDQLRLDIVDPPADGRDAQKGDGIMFFGRRSFGESTWVVSLFVVLELVAFVVTMFLNDCPGNSDGNCILKSLGRFSFQPISENPLLGPSSSTLEKMGALQRTLAIQKHQEWRLVTCSWLHAGVAHLIVNLLCLILVGVRLEQDYGPLRIGIIYVLSAFLGSLVSALFVQSLSAVGSSGALSGLLGAMLSALVSNWKIYDDKVVALVALAFITITNFLVGLLPYVDNFSNIGGFLAGILLGCVFLFNPRLGQIERKKGIFDFNTKDSVKLKHKLDRPAKRIAALFVFSIMLAGTLLAVLHGVNTNKYCSWCHYIDCVPTKMWSCNEKAIPCEAKGSDGQLNLTCKADGNNFRT